MYGRYWVMLLPVALVAQSTELTSAQKEYFEARIRPVLAQQCFGCHTNSQSGGLRLDTREDLLKGGKSGPAVVPGEPDKSLLINAIRHAGPLQMPKNASKLTDAMITDFSLWVKDGAYWPVSTVAAMKITDRQRQFWSYQPLKPGATPAVKDTAWPTTDIDRHVLARLEKDGLKPTPVADRRTLIRRAAYDLTGLPPTLEEVKAFENDKSPNAWEKVIDRLLASPRYGETWARHWMDVVRYGEDDYNVGKLPDRAEKYPNAYIYRDWLINAFNDDLPYDTFVKAQLAADLMDEKVRAKFIPALGLHGSGVWAFQANPAPIERADEWHDKVDVTTKAFLGLTVGCARCHNHKYDAIPTKDYYALASVFASTNYHAYPQVPKAVQEEYEAQKKVLEEKQADYKKFLEQAGELYAQSLLAQAEDYMLAAWKIGDDKKATVQGIADERKLDAELLERWVKFLKKKPTNYPFATPWQEMVSRKGDEAEAKKIAAELHRVMVDVSKEYEKLTQDNLVAIAKYKLKEKDKIEEFDPMPNGKKRRLISAQIDLQSLPRERQYFRRDIFEVDLPEVPEIIDLDDIKTPGLLKVNEWSLEKRLPKELAAQAQRMKDEIEAYKKAMPPEPPFVYGIGEAKEPATLRVFVRGNAYTFGEEAPRAFLSIFSDGEPKRFVQGSGRLELAEEILKQPITARVVVNRIWRWHMGSGFVETPNNFGVAGEKPSNPELLDLLAKKFIDGGLSWKKLHKQILLSKVYQLSAVADEASSAKDPANRLYWRANRRRLDAEGVWDALLTASGKLDTSKLGGPSEDIGDLGMTRRGVYGKTSRMYPNNFLTTFDAPAATISNEFRYMTNVPQQRLFFLNSDFVRKQAELMAGRVGAAQTREAQAIKAFELAYQRTPSPAEVNFAVKFLEKAEAEASSAQPPATAQPVASVATVAAQFAAKPETPASLVSTPQGQPSAALAPLTPLQSLCWALLSSNEFLYLN